MCGIVGLASNFSNGFSMDEAQAFQDMLYVDTLRGWDSTGVFGIDKNASVEIIKDVSPGSDFICTQQFKDLSSKLIKNGLFAIGHNRAATKGAITDENAHPFWVDNKIILVQNGSMISDHKKFANVEVDSHAITHLLATEPDITKALQQIDGGWCLNWFNTETETLHLIRNAQRPMYIARFKNGAMWASEIETLYFAAGRNHLKFEAPPQSLAPHKMVTMKIKGHGFVYAEEALETFYRPPETISPKHYGGGQHPPYSRGPSWGDGYDNIDWTDDGTTSGLYTQLQDGTWILKATNQQNNIRAVHGNITQTVVTPLNDPTLLRKHDVHHLKSNGKSEVRVNMADYAANNLREFHAVGNDYIGLMDISNRTRQAAEGKVQVEVLDCIPANHHPECTTWHLYGQQIFAPEDTSSIQTQVLVHWFLYDMTRAEAEKEVDKCYFEVTCSSVNSHRYTFQNQPSFNIVKIYGFEPTSYIDSKDPAQEQNSSSTDQTAATKTA